MTLHVTLLRCLAASTGTIARYWPGPIRHWRAPEVAATVNGMKKRILAAFLWFYAGWYAGAMLADVIGITPLFGPLLGAAVAALIVGDPRRVIWTRPQPSIPASPSVNSPEPA